MHEAQFVVVHDINLMLAGDTHHPGR
jgi:hypothetical protein